MVEESRKCEERLTCHGNARLDLVRAIKAKTASGIQASCKQVTEANGIVDMDLAQRVSAKAALAELLLKTLAIERDAVGLKQAIMDTCLELRGLLSEAKQQADKKRAGQTVRLRSRHEIQAMVSREASGLPATPGCWHALLRGAMPLLEDTALAKVIARILDTEEITPDQVISAIMELAPDVALQAAMSHSWRAGDFLAFQKHLAMAEPAPPIQAIQSLASVFASAAIEANYGDQTPVANQPSEGESDGRD
jgi:hypothetical protein